MDQTRAINALAPFVALAKSANSPRAAADLITQATSAANTYVFAELLQQPNIQNLVGHEQYGVFFTLLQCFAWGTYESYKDTPGLPPLSDPQIRKLRQLSLLTIASEKTTASNLVYTSLCARLDLSSTVDLEHLVTEAIYSGLLTGTLNPASQTVAISSVAPLRDLAPGSVHSMMAELEAWSGRCDSVLADLEAEIKKVKSDAEKRAKREAKMEKQIAAVTETEKATTGGSALGGGGGGGGLLSNFKAGRTTRGQGGGKREQADDDEDDYEDAMDVDDGGGRTLGGGGARKKSGGGSGLMSKLTGKGGSK